MAKWENVYGFEGINEDLLPEGYSAITPDDNKIGKIALAVDDIQEDIERKCHKDIIPGEVLFDIFDF